MKQQITYHLMDDAGLVTIELEVLMLFNTVFEHEYGTYMVDEIKEIDGQIHVDCERITTHSKLRKPNF